MLLLAALAADAWDPGGVWGADDGYGLAAVQLNVSHESQPNAPILLHLRLAIALTKGIANPGRTRVYAWP